MAGWESGLYAYAVQLCCKIMQLPLCGCGAYAVHVLLDYAAHMSVNDLNDPVVNSYYFLAQFGRLIIHTLSLTKAANTHNIHRSLLRFILRV